MQLNEGLRKRLRNHEPVGESSKYFINRYKKTTLHVIVLYKKRILRYSSSVAGAFFITMEG